jgi:polysaccharide pyruvyl transferase WcaK-like protein
VEYLYTEDVYTYLSFLKNTRLNITYRLHSFLPCLSFGVPSIKISYDQRALSLIETIGMAEWNINMLVDDVVEEVVSRIKSLDKLEQMREQCKTSVWRQLRDTITDNFGVFAAMVNDKR